MQISLQKYVVMLH